MSSRKQTLVQLNDRLVDLLDQRAQRAGESRSAVIRGILEEALESESENEISRRIRAGYRRIPQAQSSDEWGDLDRWTQESTRRSLAATAAEEKEPW